MSKIKLVLGSFLVGASSMFFALSLLHPSMRAQAFQTNSTVIGGEEPSIPPLATRLSGGPIGVPGAYLSLDGLNCDGCTIETNAISYAGGAFRCENCSIGAKSVQFKGAAVNTLNALQLFGVIPAFPPSADASMAANPSMGAVIKKQPEKVSWISLAGITN